MENLKPPSAPTSSGPLPPWLQKPSGTPARQVTPPDIPGPWSRPAPVKPATPTAPPQPNAPSPEATKDWGPLKPIRTVPKPDEKKVSYILAQTERVVNPDAEGAQKKWIILGSIATFIVIVGGTFAFIFFGRSSQAPKLDSNSVTIVNTSGKNGNVNSSDLFPSVNTYRNVNTNSANGNSQPALDTDSDGLTDTQEALYGTDKSKPDTDGDGYTDSQEVQGGYNPLGPGKLAE